MMIECPRCGFSQPKDQYCANCGVNIDLLLARPKPFFVRLVQNPNFYLGLIAILIAIVVGWILYTQSALVSREVSELLDLPLSSRNAGDPDEVAPLEAADESTAATEEQTHEADVGVPTTAPVSALAVGASQPAEAAVAARERLEVTHWEISRESLATLLPTSQRLSERAYLWNQPAKVLDALQASAEALGPPRTVNLAAQAQINNETAPSAPEMFQFALLTQVNRFDAKEAQLRWAINMILPQPENPNETGPVMRQVMEYNVTGNGALPANGLIMLVMDPPNRAARDEYVQKAGEGPWAIFGSPEFRAGVTDWVIVLQLK